MKTLLEFFVKYFDVLYLDPRYHITDSNNRGLPTIDAAMRLTGPILSWYLANNRGQMELTVAPTLLITPDNWFWVSLVKQYLNGNDEIEYSSAPAEIEWVRENGGRIEELFSDVATLETTCETLRALRQSNSDRYWGRWRQQEGLF